MLILLLTHSVGGEFREVLDQITQIFLLLLSQIPAMKNNMEKFITAFHKHIGTLTGTSRQNVRNIKKVFCENIGIKDNTFNRYDLFSGIF